MKNMRFFLSEFFSFLSCKIYLNRRVFLMLPIGQRRLGHQHSLSLSNALRRQPLKRIFRHKNIQSNLNSSNTDGSFTMAYSNPFLSPYEILPTAQENKYLGKCSYCMMKLYVV